MNDKKFIRKKIRIYIKHKMISNIFKLSLDENYKKYYKNNDLIIDKNDSVLSNILLVMI